METLKATGRQHPMVVGVGKRGQLQQAFLVVENETLPIKRGGLVAGLDCVMKLYFIMQMAYPPESSHILQFLQYCILGVNEGEPMKCRSIHALAQYVKSKQ